MDQVWAVLIDKLAAASILIAILVPLVVMFMKGTSRLLNIQQSLIIQMASVVSAITELRDEIRELREHLRELNGKRPIRVGD